MKVECGAFKDMDTVEDVREKIPERVSTGDLEAFLEQSTGRVIVRCAGCGVAAEVEDEQTAAEILELAARAGVSAPEKEDRRGQN